MSEYYDIPSILSEEEKVPAVLIPGVKGIGRALDPSCDTSDLAENTKLEIPFWLARALAKRNMVAVKQPKFYGKRIQEEIDADSGCVNLRECSQYYYSLGILLSQLFSDSALKKLLLSTFQQRYKEILSKCHSIGDEIALKQGALLTAEEVNLMERGRISMMNFSRWLQRSHNIVTKASAMAREKRRGASNDNKTDKGFKRTRP